MPHDKNGYLLQVGDLVNIPCVVKSVQPATNYCNVTLDTVESMPPYTVPSTITINTRQVKKVAALEVESLDPLPADAEA